MRWRGRDAAFDCAPFGRAVAAGLLLGCVCAAQAASVPGWNWCLAGLCVGLGMWTQRWPLRAPAAALVGASGFLLAAHGSLALRIPATLEDTELWVEGTVVGLPERDPERDRFEFRVERASRGGTPVAIDGLLRLAIYRDPLAVRAGERLRMIVRLRRPRGLRSPDGFDFEQLALERRYAATGHALQVLSRDTAGDSLDVRRAALSGWLAGAVADPDAAGLLRALAVGDQAAIPDRLWEVFRATGTTHLVAISGFHIGLVASACAGLAALLHWLLPALGLWLPRRPLAALCGLLGAGGYSLLAGLSLPVQRTLVMIIAVLVAVALRRRLPAGGALAWACLAVLAFDPLAVLNAGFWLSFAGVFWLLYALGGRSRETWWRSYSRAQWVAFLALLPLGIAWFQQLSLVGPLVNFGAIPWVSFVLVPLLLLALGLHALSLAAASTVIGLAAHAAQVYLAALDWAARLPLAQLAWPAPGAGVLLLACAGVAICLLPRAVAGRSLGLILLLPLLWPRMDRPAAGSFDLTVLDVGQGQAVIVRTAQHALLYDAGPARPAGLDFGEAVVGPALRAQGVRRLDMLMISHGDNDHAGGAAAITRSHQPRETLSGPGTRFGRDCVAGQRWRWDGVDFEILHPPAHFPALRNEASCVLRIAAGSHAALLPGDITEVVESRLVQAQVPLRAGLLLLPHHGSRSSSSQPFLDAVAAQHAVASAAYRSRFGHPAPEVVQRLSADGASLQETARTGAVQFLIGSAEGIVLRRAERRADPHLWQEP